MRGEMKERISGTAIKSITQPLVVLSLGFGLPTLGAAHWLTGRALDVDLILAVLFPALFAITHLYFMIRSPDRLQSEEWRLRDRRLTMLESGKGIISDPRLLKRSADPKIVSSTKVDTISLTSGVDDADSNTGEEFSDPEIEPK